MRPVLATLLAGTWLFLSGALVYVFLMANIIPPLMTEVALPAAVMPTRLWAVAVEKLVLAGALTVVGTRQLGLSWVRRGVNSGLLGIGLFQLPFCFSVFGNFRIPASAVGWIALEGSLRLIVAGFIIASVLGVRRANA